MVETLETWSYKEKQVSGTVQWCVNGTYFYKSKTK